MLNIRQNVFETNSSSVHAMIICTEKEYEKARLKEMLVDPWREELITAEEAVAQLFKLKSVNKEELRNKPLDELVALCEEHDVAYLIDHWSHEGCEEFLQRYTTPGGEKIVAFGYAGRDG